MRRLRVLRQRFASLFRSSAVEESLSREIDLHIELLKRQYLEQGMTEREATEAARREFGPAVLTMERCREHRGVTLVDESVRDLRHALRRLISAPGFAIPVVLTLGFGLGGNMALFQLVDTFILRSLPVREPERLIQLSQSIGLGFISKSSDNFPLETFAEMKKAGADVGELIAIASLNAGIAIDGQAEPVRQAAQVSENLFTVLGVPAAAGRVFVDADSAAVAVLSHRFWRERFNADPAVVGRIIDVGGERCTILGVAAEGFKGLTPDRPVDVWSPLPPRPQGVRLFARLAPGVTPDQAAQRWESLYNAIAAVPALKARVRMHWADARAGYSEIRRRYGRPLLVLFSGVALLMVLACVNLSNLMLARASARQREMSVCLALGAGRGRLTRQLMAEAFVLAMAGALAGAVLATLVIRSVMALLPGEAAPELAGLSVDGRLLMFSGALTLLVTVLFGALPAWRATRGDELEGLREGARGDVGGRRGLRMARVLLATQVALSIPLLAAAGLFMRTLSRLMTVDPGYSIEHLLQVKIDTARAGYARGKVGPLYRELLARVAAIPGVDLVTGVRNGMLEGASTTGTMKLPERGIEHAVFERADVGPRFFATMRIPILAGRDFSQSDTASSPLVVAANETFVRRYLPGENAIGARIDNGKLEIIAVVKDMRFRGLRHTPQPMLFYPALQAEPDRVSALEVRTSSDPLALAGALQREIGTIHPHLVTGVKTMKRQREESLTQERLLAFFAAGFGALAVALVAVGIYGVANRALVRRLREIGLRKALGAQARELLTMVLGDSARPVLAGMLAGSVLAWWIGAIARAHIASFLFEVSLYDAPAIAATALVIVVSAASATFVPALRAARVDPMVALRQE